MSRRLLAVATGLVLLALAPKPTVGQGTRGKWMLPRTPWGEPDLSGIWDFRTMTSLERPDELAGKEVLTDDEAAEYERKRLRALDKDRRASDGDGDGMHSSNSWSRIAYWGFAAFRCCRFRRAKPGSLLEQTQRPWT